MKKYGIVMLSVLMLFSVVLAACSSETSSEQVKSTLDVVKERGYVIVGVNNELPGFGYVDSAGNYAGFDVDFGRAIAAALFDDPDKVEFRPLSATERFTAVQSGEVDVLSRNSTWTTSRDSSVGLNFVPTTFYDGQGIMVRKDSGITSIQELDGMRIGVDSGTTTELNLASYFRKLGIDFEPVVYNGTDAVVASYEAGNVDAWTTDKSGLVSRLSTLSNPEEHVILEETMSKEPLGPAVKAGDNAWYDAVKWIIFATIQAEEFGITSENIDSFMSSEDPAVLKFLGVEDTLGKGLGLENDFAVRVVKHLGNYGEIFDRHLGEGSIFNLERGQNDLWFNGGLLYSPPFN